MAQAMSVSYIKSLIFDLDGVLLNSEVSIRESINQGLRSIGRLPLTDEEIRLLLGPPLLEGLRSLLLSRGESDSYAEELLEKFRVDYVQRSVSNALLFEGVREALQSLSLENVPMGVATSKPARFAVPILEKLEVLDLFVCIGAPEDGNESESKDEILRRVLDFSSEFDYRTTAMIGDRHFDMIAAISLNVEPVGVLWGYGTESELLSAGAVRLLDEPADLLGLVG